MSIYYRDSGLTWSQYMQESSFVQDITDSIQRSSESMTSAISNQTQNIVASNEALGQAFDYGLEQISGEISELRAAFDYSMGLTLEQLRIQTRTLEGILDQLDAIHETLQHPLLTQARELSKIGMDNVSKGLLQEGLESLLASAEKNRTDFLVQLQIGKLYLYGKDATDDVIDLPNAKEHLLLAARYANSEISSLPDAAKFCAEAFLHSAITCYAQANENFLTSDADEARRFTEEALELSQKATQVYPQLSEGFYNHAKFAALLNDGETAVNSLKMAIITDRNYCLKAEADRDFDGVREYIHDLFESLRQQAKVEAEKSLDSTKLLLDDWVYQSSEEKQVEAKIRELIGQAESIYHSNYTYFDYFDSIMSTVELTTLTEYSSLVFSVSFSPDGKYLASGSYDKTVKIYQTDDFKEIATLTGHSDLVRSVSFSPDGRYLASGSFDATVKIYQTDDFKEIATLIGHSDSVRSVSFSPDGRYLASGSSDATVKIYQTDGFKEIATLTGHAGSVESVSFSPNGRYLASGSYDKTVKIWEQNIISRQEFEEQEKRRIEVEREAEQRKKETEEAEETERRRKKAEEAEAERQRKEQELRDYRLKNKLCLECGEKLGFWDKLSGAQYCKRHRK